MAIAVGVASVAVGIGIPVFYESQIDNAVSIISQLEYRKMVFTQLFILILEVLTKYVYEYEYEYEYMIMICLFVMTICCSPNERTPNHASPVPVLVHVSGYIRV